MKPFEYYKQGDNIKKASPNLNITKSLIIDSENRIKDAFSLDGKYLKIIFETIYDALREFCDALLSKDGYKSHSHEASISYLSKYNFSIAEISELDNFRVIRNGSKYYGRIITQEDIKNIKEFYNKIKPKMEKIKKEIIK